jgi:hypothetical protein
VPNIGDLIKTTAGKYATVRVVSTSGQIAADVDGKRWILDPEDYTVLDVDGSFAALMAGVEVPSTEALIALYPEATTGDLVTRTPAPEGCAECLESPDNCECRAPVEDGSVIAVPNAWATDHDGDKVVVADMRGVPGMDASHAFFIILRDEDDDKIGEVHLTESQALHLAAFVFRQSKNPPPSNEIS